MAELSSPTKDRPLHQWTTDNGAFGTSHRNNPEIHFGQKKGDQEKRIKDKTVLSWSIYSEFFISLCDLYIDVYTDTIG